MMEPANEADGGDGAVSNHLIMFDYEGHRRGFATRTDHGSRPGFTRFRDEDVYDAPMSSNFFRSPIALNILLPRTPTSTGDCKDDSAMIGVRFHAPLHQPTLAGQAAPFFVGRRRVLARDA